MVDIEKAVQLLLDGSTFVKINFVWDYKRKYQRKYGLAKALIRRSGGCNVAIAGMRPPDNDVDEFYTALKIITEFDKRSRDGNGKL